MSDPMPRQRGREALLGVEVHTLDLIFEVLTSEQLAKLLRAPLELAAAKGNRDLAQRLVGAGAEIGDATHQAIRGGHGEIVNDLLESGASLTAKDTHGAAPLHVAALHGRSEEMQLLLLKGADKDEFDSHWTTPLVLAANSGGLTAVLALLAAGADVNLRCGELKAPVVYRAAALGHVEILRAVIKYGADVNAVDAYQRTALHATAWLYTPDSVDVLVDVLVGSGADIDARDCEGSTPLHHASHNLNHEALLALLKHGANVNAQTDGLETPLMNAAAKAGTQGAAEVVDSLLRAGADETIVDGDGNKPEDVIGMDVEEEDHVAEDVERVRKLLANAPADRAWRRRGYLVLCRAYPDRVQQRQMTRGIHRTDTAPRTHSHAATVEGARGVAWDSEVDENTGDDWAILVAKVLLQEEGIFRTIVGYL